MLTSVTRHAGLDQELNSGVSAGVFAWESLATAAVANDTTTAAALDRATRNTLRLKFASGLFDAPFAATAPVPQTTQEDVELARDAVRQGAVLLLNGQNMSATTTTNSTVPRAVGTLPLNIPALKAKAKAKALEGTFGSGAFSVAVIGPNADGADAEEAMLGGYGNGAAAPGSIITVADALRAEFGTEHVTVEQGAYWCNTSEARDAAAVASAVAAARSSGLTVLVLGDSGGKDQCDTCGEGKDRLSLDLPGSQLRLLKAVLDGVDPADTTVIVILIHGRCVKINSIYRLPAW